MNRQGEDLSGRTGEIALWVLQMLLAAAFVFSGYTAFAGDDKTLRTFEAVGVGGWLRYATGVLEIAGAIGLFVPLLAGTAAIGLAGVMIGAVFTEVFLLDDGDPILPLVLLALCCVVAVFRRQSVVALLRALRIIAPRPEGDERDDPA